MVLKGFRASRKLQNTMRTHMDTAGAGLTFPNIEKLQFSRFWEFQCIRNDPQNLPVISFLKLFKTLYFNVLEMSKFKLFQESKFKLFKFTILQKSYCSDSNNRIILTQQQK